jgi:hypothetical protein
MASWQEACTPLKTHILREAQDGPHFVAPEHMREQLMQAKRRLKPRMVDHALTMHFTWDDPHSRMYLEPGCFALGATFKKYGYKSEQLRFDSMKSPSEVQRLAEVVVDHLRLPWNIGKYSMIIVHYRGKAEYRDADENYTIPHVILRPSTEGYSGQVNFTRMFHTFERECPAQVVFLMDCDYPFRPLTDPSTSWRRDIPQYGCNPILAAVSGRPDYGTDTFGQRFNSALILHLEKALHDKMYHSLSTLLCAMYLDGPEGLKPIASRGYFGGTLKYDFHACSPCFTPSGSATSDLRTVRTVQPSQLLGTVLVKVRMSLEEDDTSEPLSQMVAELQQWFTEVFQSSSSHGTGKLVEVVDSASNDGFVRLTISRALWHCCMPFRGWIEIIDGVDQPEGIVPYYGEHLGEYPACLTCPITPKDSPELPPRCDTPSDYDSSEDMSISLFD